jgi:hypothetical protein
VESPGKEVVKKKRGQKAETKTATVAKKSTKKEFNIKQMIQDVAQKVMSPEKFSTLLTDFCTKQGREAKWVEKRISSLLREADSVEV